MRLAYLGLGGNLGDRLGALRRCVGLLRAHGTLERLSSVYETAPVGVVDQPAFLNCVVALATGLAPHELARAAHGIERDLGRIARERWGPREIDVDVLLYGDLVMCEPDLVIPHARMTARAFVLIPLVEIAPELRMPGTGEPVTELLGLLNRTAGDVVLVAPAASIA